MTMVKTSDDLGFSLEGNVENRIFVTSKEKTIAIFTATVMEIEIWVNDGEHV